MPLILSRFTWEASRSEMLSSTRLPSSSTWVSGMEFSPGILPSIDGRRQVADLDGFDRHAGLEVPAYKVQLWLVAVQSCGFAAPATVPLQGFVGVVQQSAGGTTRRKATVRTITDAADVVVMGWTAGCLERRRSSSASHRRNLTLSPGKDAYVQWNQPFNSQKMLSWTRVVLGGRIDYNQPIQSLHRFSPPRAWLDRPASRSGFRRGRPQSHAASGKLGLHPLFKHRRVNHLGYAKTRPRLDPCNNA
jgi:hypothetical protein